MGMRFYLVSAALAATTWSEAGVENLQGVQLDGFELVEARPGSRVALVEQAAGQAAELDVAGHGVYPLGTEYPGATYLRSGSFGEAWDAVETVNGKQTRVVLKIFYRKDSYNRISYLQQGYLKPSETEAVKEATAECHLARNMITQAPAGDVGAQRIVNCLHDRVTGRRTGEALYLVLEHGGTSLEQWVASSQGARASLEERRKIVGQLLQGIRTMGELEPTALVHHDLKPGNAVYDGTTAKLIDFGGTMLGTTANMYRPAVATPGYAPPEFLGRTARFQYHKVSFGMPATSYDMYAMGMIYAEIMCAGSGLSISSLAGFARTQFKQKSQLRQLLRSCPVPVPAEDQALMMAMMSYEHDKRPLASVALLTAPFDGIPEFNDLDGGSVPAHSDEGSELLAQSIVPKNWNNPNVRGGRGGLFDPNVVAAVQSWQGASRCKSRIATPVMTTAQFASMTGTKAQCQKACEKYSIDHTRFLVAAYGSGLTTFCCEMEVFRDAYNAQGRNCFVGEASGVDDLLPAIENTYAVVLPMPESADAVLPHLDVAAGPPAVGQKWRTPVAGDPAPRLLDRPVVGNVFGHHARPSGDAYVRPSGGANVFGRPRVGGLHPDVPVYHARPSGAVPVYHARPSGAADMLSPRPKPAGPAHRPSGGYPPARFIRPDRLAPDPQERRPVEFYRGVGRRDVRDAPAEYPRVPPMGGVPVDPAGVSPFQRYPGGQHVRRGVYGGLAPPGGLEARLNAYDRERQERGGARRAIKTPAEAEEWLNRL